MPRNSSQHDVIGYRRERVASLRLRGLTQRAIVRRLAEEGLTNPESGRPFSLGTINSDVEALEKAWRQHAIADTGVRRGRILAQLDELLRLAWANADLNTVMRIMQLESNLIGRPGADPPKTSQNRAERTSESEQIDRPQLPAETMVDLLRRVQLHAEPAQFTLLLDEYGALADHHRSFMAKLQMLADQPDLPPEEAQQEAQSNSKNGTHTQGGKEDDSEDSV